MKKNRLSKILKPNKTILLLSVSLALFARQAQANNIAVSNASIVGQNTTAGVNNASNYSMVKFDLSWENSWRTSTGPSNWDAALLLVKYSICFNTNSSAAEASVTSTNPGKLGTGTTAPKANTVLDEVVTLKGLILPRSNIDPKGVASMIYDNTANYKVKALQPHG
jgi:hypothetical protein